MFMLFGLVVVSKGCIVNELINVKFMILKVIEKYIEEKVQIKIEDDICNQYEDFISDKKSMCNLEINCCFKWILVIVCVIFIVVFFLSVLIMFGKIGYGCGCFEKEGQFYLFFEIINSLVLLFGFECCCQLLLIVVGSCWILLGCC